MIYQAVTLIHRACGKELGTVHRNTDYLSEDEVVWTLRYTTGRTAASEIAEMRSRADGLPSGMDLLLNRQIADLDYLIVTMHGPPSLVWPLSEQRTATRPWCVACNRVVAPVSAGQLRDAIATALTLPQETQTLRCS